MEKDLNINIRVDKNFKELITKKAKEKNQGVSDYLRGLVIKDCSREELEMIL